MRRKLQVGKAINFNPSESIPKGTLAKKIPMSALTEFQRKINGFEYSIYASGPKFRNGDTLVAKITPCLENGKTAFVDILNDQEVAFGSSEFIVLRSTSLSDSNFIYYFARSPIFRERAVSCMEGTSGRKRVNENTLKNLEFVFPDLHTQKSIAKVLSDLDAKIELNNKINRELEAMAKTLYDYWFVQFDFPNEDGKPYKSSGGKMVYNPELKREIPEGWEASNILKVSELIGGGTPTKANEEYWNGDIPFFTPSDSNDEVFILKTAENITTKGLDNSSTRLFEKNCVFITARGSVGRLVLNAVPMAMNQSCYAFKPKNEITFTYLFFLVNELIHHLKVKATGSVFNSIVSNDIEFTKLSIPLNSKIVNMFGKVVEPIFDKIKNLIIEKQQLIEIRDWLLPMLMNGQISVQEAEQQINFAAEPIVNYGSK